MQLSKFIPLVFIIAGCSSASKIQRLTSSTDSPAHAHQGKISLLTGDDTGKVGKLENDGPTDCGFSIAAKNELQALGPNCFEYKVRSTFWSEEVTLKTEMNSKTGVCTSAASSKSIPDPADPKASFVHFVLEFQKNGLPWRFAHSTSYGFSAVAKVCTLESL